MSDEDRASSYTGLSAYRAVKDTIYNKRDLFESQQNPHVLATTPAHNVG